jgi:uncharacterized membrane protein YcfT
MPPLSAGRNGKRLSSNSDKATERGDSNEELMGEDVRPGCTQEPASGDVAPDRQRVLWVDYAKGRSIVLEVMMHSALGVGLTVGASGWLHEVVAFAKPFRMPDFFLISGLFFGRVIDRAWREFPLDKSVVHFAYFYALWFLIALMLKARELGVTEPATFLRAYLWGFVEPFSSMWFIQLLPFFFVATCLCRRAPTLALLVTAAALHLLATFHPEGGNYAMSSKLTEFTTIDSFALFFVYFPMGHLFRKRLFAFAGMIDGRPIVAFIGPAAWAIVERLAVRSGLPEIPGLTILLGLAGALAVVTISTLLAKRDVVPWLAYCGRNSLVIYLAFFAPMAATWLLLALTGWVEDVGLMSLIVAAVAIVVPLILNAIVRRTPLGFLFERPQWARLRWQPQALAAA